MSYLCLDSFSRASLKEGHPFLAGSESAALRGVADLETEQQQDSVGPENSLGLYLASLHLSPSKERHFKKCQGKEVRNMGYEIKWNEERQY